MVFGQTSLFFLMLRRHQLSTRTETRSPHTTLFRSDAGVGIANTTLTWGPLCLLVVLAPTSEMALYAISTRTAQLIIYLMPAIALLTAPRNHRELERLRGQHGRAALRLSLIGLAIDRKSTRLNSRH